MSANYRVNGMHIAAAFCRKARGGEGCDASRWHGVRNKSTAMRFADRHEAGRLLAEHLRPLASSQPIVLALPRGGVPVGYQVATALGAPLEVFVVRKIGAPMQPELGLGAIAEGGIVVLDERLCAEVGVEASELDAAMCR